MLALIAAAGIVLHMPTVVITEARLAPGATIAEGSPYYPPAARGAGLEGHALVECAYVAVDTLMRDCRLTRESPRGQGFGQAALRLANESVRPGAALVANLKKTGDDPAGAHMLIPFEFRLTPATP